MRQIVRRQPQRGLPVVQPFQSWYMFFAFVPWVAPTATHGLPFRGKEKARAPEPGSTLPSPQRLGARASCRHFALQFGARCGQDARAPRKKLGATKESEILSLRPQLPKTR